MSRGTFVHGSAGSTFRPVAYFNSQQGGTSLLLVNRSDDEALEYRLESAAGHGRGVQSADWGRAQEVHSGSVPPVSAARVHDVPDEEDFRQFRLLVRGAGVRYIATFSDPAPGAVETGAVSAPGIELEHDRVTDVLTIRAVGGLTFDGVFSIGSQSQNGAENYLDLEVVRDENWQPVLPLTPMQPQDPTYSFIIESPTVITIQDAMGWLAFYGEPDVLTQLTFCSDLWAESDPLHTWTGEFPLALIELIATPVTFDVATDRLTLQVTGDRPLPVGNVNLDVRWASIDGPMDGYLGGVLDEDGVVVAENVRAYAQSYGHSPEYDMVLSQVKLHSDNGYEGVWKGVFDLPSRLTSQLAYAQRTGTVEQPNRFIVGGSTLQRVTEVQVQFSDEEQPRSYDTFIERTSTSLLMDLGRDVDGKTAESVTVVSEEGTTLDTLVLSEAINFPVILTQTSEADGTLRLTGLQLDVVDTVYVQGAAFGWESIRFDYSNPAGASPSGVIRPWGVQTESDAVITSWTATEIVVVDSDLAGATLNSATVIEPIETGGWSESTFESEVAVLGTPPAPYLELHYTPVTCDVLLEVTRPHIAGVQGQITTITVPNIAYIGGSFRLSDAVDTTSWIACPFDGVHYHLTQEIASIGIGGVVSTGSDGTATDRVITVEFSESVGAVELTADTAALYAKGYMPARVDAAYLNVENTQTVELSSAEGSVIVPAHNVSPNPVTVWISQPGRVSLYFNPSELGETVTELHLRDAANQVIASWAGVQDIRTTVDGPVYVTFNPDGSLLIATTELPMDDIAQVVLRRSVTDAVINDPAAVWSGGPYDRTIPAAAMATLGSGDLTAFQLHDAANVMRVMWHGLLAPPGL